MGFAEIIWRLKYNTVKNEVIVFNSRICDVLIVLVGKHDIISYVKKTLLTNQKPFVWF